MPTAAFLLLKRLQLSDNTATQPPSPGPDSPGEVLHHLPHRPVPEGRGVLLQATQEAAGRAVLGVLTSGPAVGGPGLRIWSVLTLAWAWAGAHLSETRFLHQETQGGKSRRHEN